MFQTVEFIVINTDKSEWKLAQQPNREHANRKHLLPEKVSFLRFRSTVAIPKRVSKVGDVISSQEVGWKTQMNAAAGEGFWNNRHMRAQNNTLCFPSSLLFGYFYDIIVPHA